MGDKLAYLNSSPPRGEIPEVGNETHCPQCGHSLDLGYGLAGGGIGAYKYCHHCMTVASKTEDAEGGRDG